MLGANQTPWPLFFSPLPLPLASIARPFDLNRDLHVLFLVKRPNWRVSLLRHVQHGFSTLPKKRPPSNENIPLGRFIRLVAFAGGPLDIHARLSSRALPFARPAPGQCHMRPVFCL
jgi:hypothetical protein